MSSAGSAPALGDVGPADSGRASVLALDIGGTKIAAGVVDPSVMLHDGRSVTRSRGIDTSSTRDRSADTWAA